MNETTHREIKKLRKKMKKTSTNSTYEKTHKHLEQHTKGGGTNLKPIIGPRPKLHDTRLLVERKVFDVNLTGRLVDGGRFPLHQPVVPQGRLCGQRHLKVPVSTETEALGGLARYIEALGGLARYIEALGGLVRYIEAHGGLAMYTEAQGGLARHTETRGGLARPAIQRHEGGWPGTQRHEGGWPGIQRHEWF
jgi:hypothetical protein